MSKNTLPMAPGFGGGMANIGQAMMSNLFTPTEGIVWDLMTGNLGVIDKNNPNTVYSLELFDTDNGTTDEDNTKPVSADEEVTFQVNQNLIGASFSCPVPAFAQRIQLSEVQVGDMVYSPSGDKVTGWVVGRKGSKKLSVVTTNGTITTVQPANVNVMGGMGVGISGHTVMVVRSLMSAIGGQDKFQNMQSGLAPMLAMMGSAGGNIDFGRIMPMLLMSGGNVQQLFQTMMLMNMMGGGNSGADGQPSGLRGFF